MQKTKERKVAYFTMEVGLTSKIPTYSGGLGVLAGDMLKAAADLPFPMVGVTLLTKRGYFFQKIEGGQQQEEPSAWSVDDFLESTDSKVSVIIEGEEVFIGCKYYEIEGLEGYKVPVLFLHTDLPENPDKYKGIADSLYGGGSRERVLQEIVLGVGGVRMLKELGFSNLQRYHMNEGHSAFLSLELARGLKDPVEVKERCVFTTHTPVPAGHDQFDMELITRLLEPELLEVLPKSCKAKSALNMTELALEYSNYINGVAERHTKVSKSMFPDYAIHSITNGVHPSTWVSPHFAKIYDLHIPSWRKDPVLLRHIGSVSGKDLWETHVACKKQIIDYANASGNTGLDYDYFTLGWARRFTSYKRPEFLFKEVKRLVEIADKVGPLQIIYAGKAHPNDTKGKELIEKTISLSKELTGNVKLAYLHNYDMYVSKFMTSGVDAWLNTPKPPQEASGTSGMKCALNGVPQISVLDGWWHEGYVEGDTGWTFSTPEELYDLLERVVMPTFYERKPEWEKIMQRTIMLNGSFFNSHRMLNEYISLGYRVD
jgi:glycogen phosphorylase